jgi:hypothetical protein
MNGSCGYVLLKYGSFLSGMGIDSRLNINLDIVEGDD